MANTLPSFGDISQIDPNGNGNETDLVEQAEVDIAQETQFVRENDHGIATHTNTSREPNGPSITSRVEETINVSYEMEMEANTENINDIDITTTDPTEGEVEETQLPIAGSEGHELLESLQGDGTHEYLSMTVQEEFEDQTSANMDERDDEILEDPGVDKDIEEIDVDAESEHVEKLFQLPISKIKRIMQTDPDTNLISKEALAAVAISTEHFLAMLAQQSYKLAVRSKKKRINLEHVRSTITSSEAFDFLEGTLPELDI